MLTLIPENHKPKSPILLMNCSAAKLDAPSAVKDIYTGDAFKVLRCNQPQGIDAPQLLVLSGKHGMLPDENEQIEPYSMEVPEIDDTASVKAYLKQHKKQIVKTIKSLVDKDRDFYVFLTKKYLSIFRKAFAKGALEKLLTGFRSFYICEDHRGSLQFKSRLKKALNTMSGSGYPFLIYRSSVSNADELGYAMHGNPLGTTLHYVNSGQNTDLYHALLKYAEHTPLFVDNGLVSKIKKNEEVNTDFVFDEYIKISNAVTAKTAKNIVLVIPDSPSNPEHAFGLIQRHKEDILKLLKRCRMILPIHNSYTIGSIKEMLKILKCHKNLILGVPCLKKKGADLEMPLCKIEKLLNLKVLYRGKEQQAFNFVHYLGMTEYTHPLKLNSRIMLARIYGVGCSLDAGRTAAVFGFYNRTDGTRGKRVGEALKSNVIDADIRSQVMNSSVYRNHDLETELHHPTLKGLITRNFYQKVSSDPELVHFQLKVLLGPHIVQAAFDQIQGTLIEKIVGFVSDRKVASAILYMLKQHNWERFLPYVSINQMHSKEQRFEVLRILNYRPQYVPQQGMLFSSMLGES